MHVSIMRLVGWSAKGIGGPIFEMAGSQTCPVTSDLAFKTGGCVLLCGFIAVGIHRWMEQHLHGPLA
jgi:hypothetical protein